MLFDLPSAPALPDESTVTRAILELIGQGRERHVLQLHGVGGVPREPAGEGGVEGRDVRDTAGGEQVIDAQRGAVDQRAVGALEAADQDAAVGLVVAEGEVEALEAAAFVSLADAMKVPAPARALQGIAVGEGVGVLRGEVIKLDLGQAMRRAGHEQAGATQQARGDALEPGGGGGLVEGSGARQ